MVEVDEVIEKIVTILKEGFRLFWEFLESLPLKPQETLGIAAGVIFVIIIVTCCICCRYCQKKEDKKEVKGKLNMRKSHLFGPHFAERVYTHFDELDYNIESTQFDALSVIKLGQVRFSVDFDNEENIVEVTVHEAKDVPAADISGSSDPYFKVLLKPAAKKEYKTKVKKGKLDPVFEETFFFKNITYGGLTTSTLMLKVYDYDTFGTHDLLGEAKIPINDLDMTKGKVTQWRVLVPEFKSEAGRFGKDNGLGHICIGLGYSINESVLAIFILSCKDLKSVDEGGFSDPYVTLFLIKDGKKVKKRKTTVKLRTLNPAFNEAFAFELDADEIKDEVSLMFVVADYDKGEPGEPIGQCLIGVLGQGLGAKHWDKVKRSPGKPICFWHMLKPVPEPD